MSFYEDDDSRKRNIERRRETSRFAARDRRGKEADIFSDLKDVVPVVHDPTITHVDRIALLRVAATYCRLRKCAAEVLRTALGREKPGGAWSEDAVFECLDGFVVLADSDGTILYVTESVALYLGLTQTDLTGRNLQDFMHPMDFDEYVKLEGEMSGDKTRMPENIVLRMKTVISPRGRNLNLKGALFKPVSFLLRVVHSDGNAIVLLQGCTIPAGQGSVSATANAITKSGESANGTFMTRHTCDMRISYVSDALNFILRNDTRSLMGCSFYELVHPADAHIIHKSMRELFSKGHVRTPYYRLTAANNTLAWVMTEATTINHTTRGQKGQYVICIHFVLGIQGEDESLIMCTDNQPAGVPVLKAVKAEMESLDMDDVISKEFESRQPAILECIDFTPLVPESPMDMEKITLLGRRKHSIEEPRKSSYDAVLQWLFRDHPSSPAPQYGGAESRQDTPSSGASFVAAAPARACSAGVGRVGANSGARVGSGRRSGSEACREREPSGTRNGLGSTACSPLADGMAKCDLRSPAASTPSPINAATREQCTRSGTGPASVDATTDGARGLSTVPPAGAFALCTDLSSGAVQPVVSAAASPASFVPPPPGAPSPNTMDTYRQQMRERQDAVNKALADLDFPFEDLNSIAPFVAQEELQPISDSLPQDLQTLYPDLPDWTSAEPLIPAGRTASKHDDVVDMSPPSKRGFYMAPPPTPAPFDAGYPSAPPTPSVSSSPMLTATPMPPPIISLPHHHQTQQQQRLPNGYAPQPGGYPRPVFYPTHATGWPMREIQPNNLGYRAIPMANPHHLNRSQQQGQPPVPQWQQALQR